MRRADIHVHIYFFSPTLRISVVLCAQYDLNWWIRCYCYTTVDSRQVLVPRWAEVVGSRGSTSRRRSRELAGPGDWGFTPAGVGQPGEGTVGLRERRWNDRERVRGRNGGWDGRGREWSGDRRFSETAGKRVEGAGRTAGGGHLPWTTRISGSEYRQLLQEMSG